MLNINKNKNRKRQRERKRKKRKEGREEGKKEKESSKINSRKYICSITIEEIFDRYNSIKTYLYQKTKLKVKQQGKNNFSNINV